MTTTKPAHKLSFRDRLSRLDFLQACKLLGPQGKKLIPLGANRGAVHKDDVYLGGDLLRVRFPELNDDRPAVATLTVIADAKDRLHWNCTACDEPCEHVGAMLSYVLENKTGLGLAAPPKERVPVEGLGEQELVKLAIAQRAERAKAEKMKIVAADPSKPWTDYAVTSALSGKTYRVALRGLQPGVSYCSCPDFRTNTLGTCKHLMKVAALAKRKFTPRQLKQPYRRRRIAVHLRYDGEITLRLEAPPDLPEDATAIVAPLLDRPIDDVPDLLARLTKLEALPQEYHVYPDAEELIHQRLHEHRIRGRVEGIRRNPEKHPLRTTLLKIPLLPYQLDGIAFAIGAGRAILADDMGLGKTIQGVGVAELLAREAGIRRVLVVCPASLKSQWRNEIHRFCGRDVQLIAGPAAERAGLYASDCFFTICNYEQVLKDILHVERTEWDLIVLDEGQRIKNWEAKTSRVVKGLKSRFALVLSGTPLENRLDELYSVVQFIDDRRLGPGFRFFNHHRIVDEKGKVLGYKNLDDLRESLRPLLLRRTRDSVKLELPERTDEIVRIQPTDEQKALHSAHMQVVVAITRKKFLTEMDLLRLRMSLLMCRMSADSTVLVDKQKPGFSTKLERLAELFDDLADEEGRKVVLFSEWTTMLDLIQPLLKKRGLRFVRLDGSVPQARRQELVHEFQTDPECRFFITTNAGSVGLNLQAANTVINVDLPWNPAVLEQRIARAHRMGQTRNVQVYILVTEGTLEENLLATLGAKRDLALAALDANSEVDTVSMVSGAEELRSRLEVLLGAKPEANIDVSQQRAEETLVAAAAQADGAASQSAGEDVGRISNPSEQTESAGRLGKPSYEGGEPVARRERVAAAGGELLGAVFRFLGELVQESQPAPIDADTGAVSPSAIPSNIVQGIRNRLDECVVEEAGRPRLTLTLPDRSALDHLAQALSRLLVADKR
jgi:superfamily II DNA or RNA helicase